MNIRHSCLLANEIIDIVTKKGYQVSFTSYNVLLFRDRSYKKSGQNQCFSNGTEYSVAISSNVFFFIFDYERDRRTRARNFQRARKGDELWA